VLLIPRRDELARLDDHRATGVGGGQQVGVGLGTATGHDFHALLWSGTAASYINLHSFLGSGFTSSEALGIDADGNIFGSADGQAVMWVPVNGPTVIPLPSAALSSAVLLIALTGRRPLWS